MEHFQDIRFKMWSFYILLFAFEAKMYPERKINTINI